MTRDPSDPPQSKRARVTPSGATQPTLEAILEAIKSTVQSEVANAVATLPQGHPLPPSTQPANAIVSGMSHYSVGLVCLIPRVDGTVRVPWLLHWCRDVCLLNSVRFCIFLYTIQVQLITFTLIVFDL